MSVGVTEAVFVRNGLIVVFARLHSVDGIPKCSEVFRVKHLAARTGFCQKRIRRMTGYRLEVRTNEFEYLCFAQGRDIENGRGVGDREIQEILGRDLRFERLCGNG